MSDLDADFADLYGNDESEFAVPTAQTEPPPPRAEQPAVKEEPKPSIQQEPQPIATVISSYEDRTSNPPPSATNAIPSYTSSAQQIPTYQERQPDYREPAPPRHDTYQGAPGADRPVRPSEMKEEG
ncbi:hypothetical protein C8Q80DRAFT_1218419 [Daedaleopsis nitida]|nr:hypothetical protein C8Q80DRAFT_1218419 [Daedaleopsis nitida]